MTAKSIQQCPKYCVPTFYSLEKHKNLKFIRGMNNFVVNCMPALWDLHRAQSRYPQISHDNKRKNLWPGAHSITIPLIYVGLLIILKLSPVKTGRGEKMDINPKSRRIFARNFAGSSKIKHCAGSLCHILHT